MMTKIVSLTCVVNCTIKTLYIVKVVAEESSICYALDGKLYLYIFFIKFDLHSLIIVILLFLFNASIHLYRNAHLYMCIIYILFTSYALL